MNNLRSLPVGNYSVITPYLVPPGAKKINVGDGFILDSAVKLLGVQPAAEFSSRLPLSDAAIERINASRCAVAVGANTLKDDFELTPGFDLATLERIRVPVVLMGVGHYGVEQVTRGLNPASVALMRALLERFPFMSVRCDASYRYVLRSLADRAACISMTSCPVAHGVDGVDRGFRRKERYDCLVVTITDRAFLDAQLPMLAAAARLFPAETRVLALHQDYGNAALWAHAEKLGYRILRGAHCEDFLDLYSRADVHFGNRVHAHLKCLSNGVISYCTPFDLRQVYFAQSLDYPLIESSTDPRIASYDFRRFVARRQTARAAMESFVAALRSVINGV